MATGISSPRVRSPDPQQTMQLIEDPLNEYLNKDSKHVRFASQDQIIEVSRAEPQKIQTQKTFCTKLKELIWRVGEAVTDFFRSFIALPKKAFHWIFGSTSLVIVQTPPQPVGSIAPSPNQIVPIEAAPVLSGSSPERPIQQAPLAKKPLPLLELLTEQGVQKRGVFIGNYNFQARELYQEDGTAIRLTEEQHKAALLYSAVHGLYCLWKACENNLVLTHDIKTSLFIDSIIQEAFLKASKEEEPNTHPNLIIFNPSSPFEYNSDLHGTYYEADGLLKLSNRREINGFIWVNETNPNALPYFVLIDGRPNQPIGYLGFLEEESSVSKEFFPTIQVLPLREISKYLTNQLKPGELRIFRPLKLDEEQT